MQTLDRPLYACVFLIDWSITMCDVYMYYKIHHCCLFLSEYIVFTFCQFVIQFWFHMLFWCCVYIVWIFVPCCLIFMHTTPWNFQTKLLHYFFTSNNKSNLHFATHLQQKDVTFYVAMCCGSLCRTTLWYITYLVLCNLFLCKLMITLLMIAM